VPLFQWGVESSFLLNFSWVSGLSSDYTGDSETTLTLAASALVIREYLGTVYDTPFDAGFDHTNRLMVSGNALNREKKS
jgi:hypothetical protein